MSETKTELRRELRNGVPVLLDADGRVVEFWIRRENWRRRLEDEPVGGYGAKLLIPGPSDYAGQMCCQGHAALACGSTRENIMDRLTVACLECIPDPIMWMEDCGCNSADGDELVELNDAAWKYAKEFPRNREEKIAAIFAKHGLTVHFCDGTPDEFKELS